MDKVPLASVVILSTREEELKRCLESLRQLDEKNVEIILITEEGSLAALRNKGWRTAKAPIVIFIDDDTVVTKTWLEAILRGFEDPTVGGVSGPSVIQDAWKQNRDIFRFKKIKRFYDWFFCEGKASLPGHITDSGAWTTGACLETCDYEGRVDFLEACNMSFRKEYLWEVWGFNEEYKGIGDWSEPDLCFRIREKFGNDCLRFIQKAKLYHLPSKTGAFKKRETTGARLKNYFLFSERWIKPNIKHILYLIFLRCYFKIVEIQTWMKNRGFLKI